MPKLVSKVNGKTIMPKLPVYLRTYREKFVVNQKKQDEEREMAE